MHRIFTTSKTFPSPSVSRARILSSENLRELTKPLVDPATDIFEELMAVQPSLPSVSLGEFSSPRVCSLTD
jgi:hypothetical protein